MKQNVHDGLRILCEGYRLINDGKELIKQGLEMIDRGSNIIAFNGHEIKRTAKKNKA